MGNSLRTIAMRSLAANTLPNRFAGAFLRSRQDYHSHELRASLWLAPTSKDDLQDSPSRQRPGAPLSKRSESLSAICGEALARRSPAGPNVPMGATGCILLVDSSNVSAH